MLARIPLDRIDKNPFQTRTTTYDVADLITSIQQLAGVRPETSGLIHSPLGRIIVNGTSATFGGDILDYREYGGILSCLGDEPTARVQLAAGHRRFAAFQQLVRTDDQYATLPIDIEVLDDQAMADVAWQENAARVDISVIEEAIAIQTAMAEFGWSQTQVGERWSLTQAAVSNKLRLLRLPDDVRSLLRRKVITERHGRALLPLLELRVGEGLLLDVLGHDGQHPKNAGDACSVADVEADVKRIIEQRTRPIKDATWPLDWAPERADDAPGDGIIGACDDCQYRVSRNHRCSNAACFKRKEKVYRIQVTGPRKAQQLHDEHTGWHRLEIRSTQCTACRRWTPDFDPQPTTWYRPGGNYSWLQICPECWTAAGLPEPEPETSGPEEIASAPVVTGALGQAPHTLDMRPATPPTETAPAEPAPPPEPPPPPAVLVTVRILPGEEDLLKRKVMVAIAEEGQAPAGIYTGTYLNLSLLMAKAIGVYFNTISQEIPKEV